MCMSTPKIKKPEPQIIAAPQSVDSNRQADIEARFRRARSGALANILTSPTGLAGKTSQLGAPK